MFCDITLILTGLHCRLVLWVVAPPWTPGPGRTSSSPPCCATCATTSSPSSAGSGPAASVDNSSAAPVCRGTRPAARQRTSTSPLAGGERADCLGVGRVDVDGCSVDADLRPVRGVQQAAAAPRGADEAAGEGPPTLPHQEEDQHQVLCR